MNVFYFIVLSLAIWRITHLFSKEDGPFDIIYRLRKAIGADFFGSLLDCFYCTSVWVALPFGLWEGNSWREKLLLWIALSGAACLLEKATDRKNNKSDEPIYLEEEEN
ncbi:MAG TPA: DUF1360 domain-containing protein [Hanamia sp.]